MLIGADNVPASPALCRFVADDAAARLGWLIGDQIWDLTGTDQPQFSSLGQLIRSQDIAEADFSTLVGSVLSTAASLPLDHVRLLAPIDTQEVWAAGVTYERSRTARMSESENAADMYWRVYDAQRPELFFKADARRTSGPGAAIRVRSDSSWSVPEPELTLLLSPQLKIIGFTIGNDVSARDIEGENPLYLPQAKVFQGSCALGPWLVPAELVADPYALKITCTIERDGAVIWGDETSTASLHRTFVELAEYLGRADSFPDGVFLMTGTCLVPPDTLSLRSGDVTTITIDGLGTLRNPVG